MDKKSGRNDRNEILKRKFDEPKAEADGTSRLLRSKQKQKTTIPNLEKAIKKYIDGIVDGVVPDLVRSGINPTDFNRAIEALVDVSYQQMEEL